MSNNNDLGGCFEFIGGIIYLLLYYYFLGEIILQLFNELFKIKLYSNIVYWILIWPAILIILTLLITSFVLITKYIKKIVKILILKIKLCNHGIRGGNYKDKCKMCYEEKMNLEKLKNKNEILKKEQKEKLKINSKNKDEISIKRIFKNTIISYIPKKISQIKSNQKQVSKKIRNKNQKEISNSNQNVKEKENDKLLKLEEKYRNILPEKREKLHLVIESGSLAQKIKKIYDYECLICKELFKDKDAHTFKKKNNEYYIETHHISFKSSVGSLGISNLLPVCPNHHRQIHYGNAEVISNDKKLLKIMIDKKMLYITKKKIPLIK